MIQGPGFAPAAGRDSKMAMLIGFKFLSKIFVLGRERTMSITYVLHIKKTDKIQLSFFPYPILHTRSQV